MFKKPIPGWASKLKMAHTVKQLAKMSGVSVRTLHHYDAIGLLPPTYCGDNGYRFYEETEVLRLQQILFYRELGIGLKQIHAILDEPEFDKIQALKSHRKALQDDVARRRRLIATIDKTIKHLTGTTSMKTEEIFEGFDSPEQQQHEAYLVDRYGENMKQSIARSKAKVKNWSKERWQETQGKFAEICQNLVTVMQQPLPADSMEAQALVRQHYQWMCQFWTPNRESYKGHTCLILDSELRNAYTEHHPELPEFIAQAIKIFAEKELT